MNRTQERQIAKAANRAAVLFSHEDWTWLDPGTANKEYPVTAAHLALMMAKQLNALTDSTDDKYTATGRLMFFKEDWSNSIRILVEVGSIGDQEDEDE
jgi:hypothetical protein